MYESEQDTRKALYNASLRTRMLIDPTRDPEAWKAADKVVSLCQKLAFDAMVGR
jgi:hypothetical protein